MSTAIKLPDRLVEEARREAKVMRRSIAKQVEYWAELGRSIERSGQFDARRISMFMRGEQEYDGLRPEEQAIARRRLDGYLDDLPDLPTEHQHSMRAADGTYSGYLEDDPHRLVTVHPDGTIEDLTEQ